MKKLLGFTLTELMIAITVLGILTAAVLPAVLGNNPNQNKIMMKKAYYTTAEVVSEMINNESLFPTWGGWNDQEYRPINFEEEMVGGQHIGVLNNWDPVDFDGINTGTQGDGIPKAILIFSRMINPKVNPWERSSEEGLKYQDPCVKIAPNGYPYYVTKTRDGMIWCFAGSTSSVGGLSVLVDVNGSAKPNCLQGYNGFGCNGTGRTENFDQFRMHIYADGAITIDDADEWAKDAITVGSSLSN